MKRSTAIFLILVLLFSFAACNGKEEKEKRKLPQIVFRQQQRMEIAV